MTQFGRGPFSGRGTGRGGGGGRGINPRLIIAGVVALFAIVSFFSMRQINPITGKVQHVSMSPQDEIALGLQAMPEMMQMHGGEDRDSADQRLVDAIGAELLRAIPNGENNPYQFEFHLLADPQTINAFALPGGQVFITRALFDKLQTEGQLAGVLAHEVGHVIERHGAQRMAKMGLTQGLVGAVAVGASDSQVGAQQAAQLANAVAQLVNLKYGREDELESDTWGVILAANAGYDPRAMIGVMDILEDASAGGQKPPEFMSTHPSHGNRVERIKSAIETYFPDGLPSGLRP
ncbi:MAG: M48 family metalloprotease [Phycisphaerales bacterium]|nr:M48 family metalloprotease [Phycisphaerales bacterium]